MKRFLTDNWREINLSQNFVLDEFVVSKDHPELAAKIIPTIEQVNNLKFLVETALQPIRDEYGETLVTSGLVSEELNNARGGVEDSQHLYGEAADIICHNISTLDIFVFCKHNLKWKGELIFYKKKGHLHIALPSIWSSPNHIIKEL